MPPTRYTTGRGPGAVPDESDRGGLLCARRPYRRRRAWTARAGRLYPRRRRDRGVAARAQLRDGDKIVLDDGVLHVGRRHPLRGQQDRGYLDTGGGVLGGAVHEG